MYIHTVCYYKYVHLHVCMLQVHLHFTDVRTCIMYMCMNACEAQTTPKVHAPLMHMYMYVYVHVYAVCSIFIARTSVVLPTDGWVTYLCSTVHTCTCTFMYVM